MQRQLRMPMRKSFTASDETMQTKNCWVRKRNHPSLVFRVQEELSPELGNRWRNRAPRRSSDLGDGGRPAGGSCLGRVSTARRRAYSQPSLHQEASGTFSFSFPASSLVLRWMWHCKRQARDMVSTLFPNEGTHHPYPSPVSNL